MFLNYKNISIIARKNNKFKLLTAYRIGNIVAKHLNFKKNMKAKSVFYHDDTPCTARLENGFCPECKFVPDIQSLALEYQCPSCKIRLRDLVCPSCKTTYERP